MNLHDQSDLATHLVQKAKALGASLAGLASTASLQDSPSYETYGEAAWPAGAESVLVLALVHERAEAELDWWDEKEGGTPGNRRLINVANDLVKWVKKELDIKAQPLPYHVEAGGIFLKDSAALAGLGTIGASNLLVTPEFGPRIRLRALFLDVELVPTGPMDFSPCDSCDMPCRRACPQKAFIHGSYSRDICTNQMNLDKANRVILEKAVKEDSPSVCIKYCRACELACPVGR